MRKLLLVTQQAFYPDASGGSEQSTAYLLEKLSQYGWQVEVICTRRIKSPYFLSKFWQSIKSFRIPFPAILDQDLGYPVWRLISKFANKYKSLRFLDHRLAAFRPDVVLGLIDLDCPLLHHAANKGFPCFYLARITGPFESRAKIPNDIFLIANSPFMASFLAPSIGSEPEIVLPFVERNRYIVKQRQRQYITFVNPVPQKGLEVAIEIARRLPNERFLFVKGNWFYYQGQEDIFLQEVYALPNVEIWEHQRDARKIYKVTDILLVPSSFRETFRETFGRVILEAQINSIPVVAAKAGGIPYTLGKGGILVEPIDEPQGYVDALKQLRGDQKFYSELSELALKNSFRPEFDPTFQVNKFIQVIENHLQKKLASRLSDRSFSIDHFSVEN